MDLLKQLINITYQGRVWQNQDKVFPSDFLQPSHNLHLHDRCKLGSLKCSYDWCSNKLNHKADLCLQWPLNEYSCVKQTGPLSICYLKPIDVPIDKVWGLYPGSQTTLGCLLQVLKIAVLNLYTRIFKQYSSRHGLTICFAQLVFHLSDRFLTNNKEKSQTKTLTITIITHISWFIFVNKKGWGQH